MPTATRLPFGLRPWRQIPGTAALSAIHLALSLTSAITERSFGFGTNALNYQLPAIIDLELWRLVTYPFVTASPWGLLINILVLWIFGGWFESSYGTRDFVRFFFSATIGAGLLAVPLSFVVNIVMPFTDVGLAEGPGSAFDAMLVALALSMPDSNILLGFVLPMRARTAVFIFLGITVVFGILTGAAALSITLGGMAMGYFLITGNWRPSRLLHRLRKLRVRRRRGLYVVPPRDKTLH